MFSYIPLFFFFNKITTNIIVSFFHENDITIFGIYSICIHYTSAGFYQVNNGSRTVEVFHSYVTYTARNIQTGAIIAEVTLENKAPSSLSSNAQSKHYMPLPTPYHADNTPKISEFLQTILQG